MNFLEEKVRNLETLTMLQC